MKLYSFIETSVFTKRLEEIASLDVLIEIQNDLLRKPDRWPVIPETGGARKGRIADPRSRRGKRGSFRYLYLYLEHRGRIYLLFLFAKKDQGNLNREQKKSIAELVRQIKEALDETS
ncbi:MAG: type II toxin-antitoxin system RelE/ParE family toxin [Acidobacteriota bacterium]